MCRVAHSFAFIVWVSAIAAMGCADTVRAPVHIVVETDLARAREAPGRLDAAPAGVVRGPCDVRAGAPAPGSDIAAAVGVEAGVARVNAQRGGDAPTTSL